MTLCIFSVLDNSDSASSSPDRLMLADGRLDLLSVAAGSYTVGPVLIPSNVYSLLRILDNSYSIPFSPNRPTLVDHRLDLFLWPRVSAL